MSNQAAEVNALLGRGSEFEGKLTFEGTVRIDGKFTGEIFSDDTLIIGEGARVKAEIAVATVIVYGDVIGNVKARTSVELHAPARLKGNITSPALVVDQGVVFDGNCNMTTPTETTRSEAPRQAPQLREVEKPHAAPPLPPERESAPTPPRAEPAIV